jgi:hypothetical protein
MRGWNARDSDSSFAPLAVPADYPQQPAVDASPFDMNGKHGSANQEPTMLITTSQARLPLPPGQTAHLQLAARTRLRGLAGQSWITLDHDRRDIVLGPGEEFVVDFEGHAMVSALRYEGTAELMVIA